MPAGFEQHRAAAVEQTLHQRIDIVLEQRLAAGDLDELAAVLLDLMHDLVERPLATLVKRVGSVAPRTAEVACGQPDEDARPPGARRLALDRVEDLVDRQHDGPIFYYLNGGRPT